MTATVAAGRTVDELAERLGVSRTQALALVLPFVQAGLLANDAGQLVVVNGLVRQAFAQEGGA